MSDIPTSVRGRVLAFLKEDGGAWTADALAEELQLPAVQVRQAVRNWVVAGAVIAVGELKRKPGQIGQSAKVYQAMA